MFMRPWLRSSLVTVPMTASLRTPAVLQLSARYCSSSQPPAASAGSSTTTPGKVTVRVTTMEGTKKEFNAPAGITLMEAIRDIAKIDMEAACDGTCACSTCHVIFTQESYDRLPDTPCEDEMDMLDLAPKVSNTSRLACQVKLIESLDTIELVIPDEMENQMSY